MRTADRLLADAVSARGIARCPGPACGCGKPADEFEEFPHLDGKSLDPEAPIEEELEGHGTRVLARSAGGSVRRLQRLTITQHKLEKGTCGQRNVQWVFSLDNAAPEDGYIVQHIRSMDFTATCPNIAMGPAAMDKEFWEAWLVKKGDKVDWTTTRDSWTDGSTRPARPGTNGRQSSLGTLKFFKKSTTGDLGDFGVAPASSSSAWGPGKVSTSGALPSTPTKPSWWDGTPVEGPVDREATSVWNCCDSDASKHTSTVTAKP